MDVEEFREKGKKMVDWISDYFKTLISRPVFPDIEPGYLRNLLPPEAPENPQSFEEIMKDVDNCILPGVNHWSHIHFHAYFSSGFSFASLLAEMLSGAISGLSLSWSANPAATELEKIMTKWLAKALGFPEHLYECPGEGAIESSASESIFMAMASARNEAMILSKEKGFGHDDSQILPKLVMYCSEEAHSCIEKAAKLLMVKIRLLETDDEGSLRGCTLQKAINEDKKKGLIPFFVAAVFGTTSTASFDHVEEIGLICNEDPLIWFHVDAAYGGGSFVCPELRGEMKGIEYVDSINVNPYKFMLISFDCTVLWTKDPAKIIKTVNPNYDFTKSDGEETDFHNWQLHESKRFRSLKIWFVMKLYGISGLQNYVHHHITLSKCFEKWMLEDNRFEIVTKSKLSLLTFRLKGSNEQNEEFLAELNNTKRIHLTPTNFKKKYCIRFAVDAERCTESDVRNSWKMIQDCATQILEKSNKLRGCLCKPKNQAESEALEKFNRLSFTIIVSKEIFQNRKVLSDECPQICVCLDEGRDKSSK